MPIRVEQWPLLYRVFTGTISRAMPAAGAVPPADGAIAEVPEGVVRAAEAEEDPALTVYDVAISSEEPVERWFGQEVLSHAKAAVDMSAIRNNAPLLFNHDRDQFIGAVKNARVDDDRKLRGGVRFLRADPKAQILRQGVDDGDVSQISVGYEIKKVKRVRAGDPEAGTRDEYLVTRWMPREVSVVSMAADQTVGFGRSASGDEKFPVEIEDGEETPTEEEREMPELKKDETPAGGGTSIEVAPSKMAADIVRLCTAHGRAVDAPEILERARTLDDAKALLLDKISTTGRAMPGRETTIEVAGKKDRSRYSYARAIYQKALEKEGEGKFDGLEAEVDQELRRHVPDGHKLRPGSILLPHRLSAVGGDGERAFPLDASITATEGQELVFKGQGEFIELLRARLACIQLGARMLSGLVGNVGFPRQTGAGTAAFVLEEGTGTDSMAAFDQVVGSPKNLMSTTGYTRQLLAQSTPDVDGIVKADLAAIHQRLLDKRAIHGTGTAPDPRGIYNTTGAGVVNMDPAAGNVDTVPTFGKLVDMIGKVADANADAGALAFLTTPLLAATLKKTLVASAAGSDMIWTGNFQDGSVAGYKALASNAVSKTMLNAVNVDTGGAEHGIVFGNWEELMFLMWGAMEAIVDPYSAKKSGRIEVTTWQLVDIIVRHGASFAVSLNAIP